MQTKYNKRLKQTAEKSMRKDNPGKTTLLRALKKRQKTTSYQKTTAHLAGPTIVKNSRVNHQIRKQTVATL
jgi:hypothetical protein